MMEEMSLDAFNKKLWFMYPKDLCHGKKGTKFNAEKAAKKLKASQYKAILDNVDALIRYDRKDIKPDRWPFVSSFLNQGYYDRDIGSMAELKEKAQSKKCSVDKCNEDVHGSMFTKCTFHISSKDERLRQAFIRTGLNMKTANFVQECRDYIDERGFTLSGLKKNKKKAWLNLDTAPRDGTVIDLWDIGGFKVPSVKWDMGLNSWSTLNDDSRYSHWREAA